MLFLLSPSVPFILEAGILKSMAYADTGRNHGDR